MRRRTAVLVLCLALLCQLSPLSVRAVDSVFFTAVGENVLPLSDETMPFWSGGYLYIPSSMFTGSVRETLGISYIPPSNARGQAILYSGGRSLRFEPGRSYAEDPDGNTYYPGAIQRGSIVFVPAYMVAEYFGLLYSVLPVSSNSFRGSMVWLRQPGSIFTDATFADAAYSSMAARYSEYLRSKEPDGEEPEAPSEEPDVSDGSFGGQNIFLCIEASDPARTAQLLDALDRAGSQAAFYCTPAFLSEQGGLLRRMKAMGHAVGILADAADPEQSVEEQLEAGNAALDLATCTRTRLARIAGGTAAQLQAALAAGYQCLEPEMDRSAYGLSSASAAETLLQRVDARRGSVSVWLGADVDAAALRAFLAAASDAGDRCLALTEIS